MNGKDPTWKIPFPKETNITYSDKFNCLHACIQMSTKKQTIVASYQSSIYILCLNKKGADTDKSRFLNIFIPGEVLETTRL